MVEGFCVLCREGLVGKFLHRILRDEKGMRTFQGDRWDNSSDLYAQAPN